MIVDRRRKMRGMGFAVAGPTADDGSENYVASDAAWDDFIASNSSAGSGSSWLTTPIASLGGIPGWAALAIGAGVLLVVAGMSGGRRR